MQPGHHDQRPGIRERGSLLAVALLDGLTDEPVGNGRKATVSRRTLLTNSIVRSIRPSRETVWWWFIQMIPMVKKLVT